MPAFEDIALWLLAIDITLVSLALLHMLYQRRTPQSLATWLLTIILLPYIGVLIYFFFGLRKSYSKRFKSKITQKPVTQIKHQDGLQFELDQLMNHNHLSGSSANNTISVIDCAQTSFSEFMLQIHEAQQSIMLQTYIFENDDTGQKILQALTQKAQAGVKVFLLLDAIGSFSVQFNKQAFKALKAAGGKVAFFSPIWPNIITNQVNLRNHRKIYLFDNKTLLTGGLNLSDDYLGEGHERLRWVDLLFKIQGDACFHYQNIFNEDWQFATGKKLASTQPCRPAQQQQIVQCIPSGPDIESDTLYEALLHAIYQAKNHIKIATPYFIPDNNIMRALMVAVKRGVKVSVLTPLKSDHWIFDFGRSSYMRELHEAGADMRYFTGNMMHAKLIIFDDITVMSGSANFDYRSLFLNYEMVHFLYCQSTIKELNHWFAKHFKAAQKYQAKHSKLTRFSENLSRIIAPIL